MITNNYSCNTFTNILKLIVSIDERFFREVGSSPSESLYFTSLHCENYGSGTSWRHKTSF